MRSLIVYPISSAVTSTNIFIDEPGWPPGDCVTTSYFQLSKPGPPTRARTAPEDGSMLTMPAVPRQYVPSFSDGQTERSRGVLIGNSPGAPPPGSASSRDTSALYCMVGSSVV